MSIIHVGHIKTTVLSRFGPLVDVSDITGPAERVEAHKLTRALAAFAVAQLANLDDIVAAGCIVDGSGDQGIDAIYYDPAEHVCFIVQAKWVSTGNGSIEAGDALKFIQGIRWFLGALFDRFNSKFRQHQDRLFEALSDVEARFVISLAYTGEQELAAEVRESFDTLLTEMNSPSEVMNLVVLNQAELHSFVASGTTGEPVNLEVMLNHWGQITEPYLAYYGQVAVADIVSWKSHGSQLTTRNLRQFRGLTEVNESISRTLLHHPERFWYFNNGVTVLCESLRKKPLGGSSRETGAFECQGASVVNGAQTVGTIIDVGGREGAELQGATVHVRLISLENCPSTFSDDLTRAANTQNRIERRDFAALDPNQKRLRTELWLECQREYVYQTGEKPPTESEGCTLDEAAIALACSKTDVALAVQAKREVGMLYEDIARVPYTQLFNSGTNARDMWNSVLLLRIVDPTLREAANSRQRKEQLIAIHGNRFVAHLVFQDVRGLSIDLGMISEPAFEQQVRLLTVTMLDRTIDAVAEHHQGAYPASLFKNTTKCRQLATIVRENQTPAPTQPPLFDS